MGKNRPDHLLQDTQSVKTHAAVSHAQWLLRLDGVVIQRVNQLSEYFSQLSFLFLLSVVKCGRICVAQTCAHSGIEPSTLAKEFLQGGPKVRIFDHF